MQTDGSVKLNRAIQRTEKEDGFDSKERFVKSWVVGRPRPTTMPPRLKTAQPRS